MKELLNKIIKIYKHNKNRVFSLFPQRVPLNLSYKLYLCSRQLRFHIYIFSNILTINQYIFIQSAVFYKCMVGQIFPTYYRYEYIFKRVIQMFNFEEAKRKTTNNLTHKIAQGSNSHNNLMSAMDKKRSDISKDKVKNHFMPESGDTVDTKGSAVINFRQIKNNQNNQNVQIGSKVTKEFFQAKLSKKPSVAQAPLGKQIHVNIQNILSNKKLNLIDAHSERTLSHHKRQQEKNIKKSKKAGKVAPNTSSIEDFECNEQLEMTVERKTQKKMVTQQSEKMAVVNQKPSLRILKIKSNEVNSIEYELKQFELKQKEINTLALAQNIYFLDIREISYKIDPLYIEKKQKNMTWIIRAILMDWMMHISYEFKFKRETLYIALILLDNFFEATYNLPKADFQLAGAAALFISAKLQEFQPLSSKQFAKSTKDRYSAEDIKAMEMKICKTLKFNLNPPTLNMWGNRIMQQWDSFIDNTRILQQPFFLTNQPKYFKKIDSDSYKNYRQMMQLLDCAILDIQTVQYKPKILVISLLYLLLGKEFNQFSKKKIVNEFPRTSTYILQESDFNNMFSYFLSESFGLQMRQILPSVQYLATYFTLNLSYDRPYLDDEQNIENMNIEEYCSYQTYNPNMISTVQKRFRGIYQ